MTMAKRTATLVMAALLLLTVAGCGGEQEPTYKEPDYSALIDKPLDLTLENLLDEATVQAATTPEVTCLGVYENGTQLMFSDESGVYQVMAQMLNSTREAFDNDVNQLPNLQPVESLGDVSWWDTGTSQLMTYVEGYAVSVYVAMGDLDMDVQPIATQLMTHILEQMDK